MITLRENEPRRLGRPVARASAMGVPPEAGMGALRFGLGAARPRPRSARGGASNPSRRETCRPFRFQSPDEASGRRARSLVRARAGWIVPGLAIFGSVCTEKDFQLADCASQLIAGATPRPPVGAASLRPPGGGPRSPVKRLKKSSRFQVSSCRDPNTETTELADIHGTSRSGTDRPRSDCTPGAAPTRPRRAPGDIRSTTRSFRATAKMTHRRPRVGQGPALSRIPV